MGAHPLPWLIPYDLHLGSGFDCYSPLEKRLRRLRFPTTPTFTGSTLCMASTRGWLLMLDVHEYYYLNPFVDNPTYDLNPFDDNPTLPFIFNPLTCAVISLPMLSIVTGVECFGALSSPPYDPDCTILLVSDGTVFMCRSNDPGDGWTIVMDIDEWIDSIVYRGGNFYCISRKRVLYIIDGVGSNSTLLAMDVSALDLRDGDRCRLVEFGGELLLVVELYDWHLRLEGFQVFRADLSGEKWVRKMDMLADHVLFLDERCSLSLLASDVGCKKNCIYCTHGFWPYVWRVFDLDTSNWIDEEAFRRDSFSGMFRRGRWFLPTLG